MPFNDLIPAAPVVAQLRRSLQRGRLAHAYLVTGPRGAGKLDLAHALAKALNCPEREHDFCDTCDACRRIAAGHHPDVYLVRPESKSRRITVDQIRDLENSLNMKASSARVKVGIITEADCMGEEASNAFLKTLEEPPAQTILLLLTAEPQRLLSTILSRCLKVAVGSSAREASAYRQRTLPLLLQFSAAGDNTVPGVYRLHAALLALLQQLKAEISERVEREDDLDRYAHLDPKLRDRLEDQAVARSEGEYRAAREQVLEELYAWFSDVLLVVEHTDPSLLDHADQQPALQRAAHGLSPERAAANLEAIESIRDALSRNISETLAIEVGLLQLIDA